MIKLATLKNEKSFEILVENNFSQITVITGTTFLVNNVGIIITCMLSLNDSIERILKDQFNIQNKFLVDSKSLLWIILPGVILSPIILKINKIDLNKGSFLVSIIYLFLLLISGL